MWREKEGGRGNEKKKKKEKRICLVKHTEKEKQIFNSVENKSNEKYKKIYEKINIDDKDDIFNSLRILIEVFNKNLIE